MIVACMHNDAPASEPPEDRGEHQTPPHYTVSRARMQMVIDSPARKEDQEFTSYMAEKQRRKRRHGKSRRT